MPRFEVLLTTLRESLIEVGATHPDKIAQVYSDVRSNPISWNAEDEVFVCVAPSGSMPNVQALERELADNEVLLKANALACEGSHDEAIKTITELLERSPYYAEAYYARGLCFRDRGDIDSAISDFDTAIRLDRSRSRFFCDRGDCFRHKGKWGDAIRDYTLAIQRDANDYVPRFGRGCCYFEMGDFPNAIRDFDIAGRLDPGSIDPIAMRARAYEKAGDKVQSDADYKRAIALELGVKSADTIPSELMLRSLLQVTGGVIRLEERWLKERLRANGGCSDVWVLCRLAGPEVRAKVIQARHGYCWQLLDQDWKPTGEFVPYRPSRAQTLMKRGLKEVQLKKPATLMLIDRSFECVIDVEAIRNSDPNWGVLGKV